MSFLKDDQLLSLISSHENEEAKSLIRNGNLFDAVDEDGNTLLHYAAEFGNAEIVQFLIDSDSNVNAKGYARKTPLISCLESDEPCTKVVEILLEAGADIYMKDIYGDRVMDLVNDIHWLNEDKKRFEIWKIILDQVSNFMSMHVLFNGDKEIIQSLLQTNVDLSTCRDYKQRTLVHVLAKNRKPGVIELLRGRQFKVDARDCYGRTPLMYAAEAGNPSAIEFLLKEGADVEAADHQKKSALYLAISSSISTRRVDKFMLTVQMLLEYGANAEYETNEDICQTIFDLLLILPDSESLLALVALPLAHLAMQETLGTPITDLIRSKIIANPRCKDYFEDCQRQLSIEIYPSITLIDALTASERQLERYFRNEELALKLVDFHTSFYYFEKILSKRVSKAAKMVKLRKTAIEIVGKLLKVKYDSYPFVFEEIVGYLEERDIENLILINDEL